MKTSHLLAAVAASFGSASAFATESSLPAGATEAFTSVTSQVTELTTLAWPLLLLVTGGFIGMRLVKKFLNRAV